MVYSFISSLINALILSYSVILKSVTGFSTVIDLKLTSRVDQTANGSVPYFEWEQTHFFDRI